MAERLHSVAQSAARPSIQNHLKFCQATGTGPFQTLYDPLPKEDNVAFFGPFGV